MLQQKNDHNAHAQKGSNKQPLRKQKILQEFSQLFINTKNIEKYCNRYLSQQVHLRYRSEIISQFNLKTQIQKFKVRYKIEYLVNYLKNQWIKDEMEEQKIQKMTDALLNLDNILQLQQKMIKTNKRNQQKFQQAKVQNSGWGLFSLFSNLVNTGIRFGRFGKKYQNSNKKENKEFQQQKNTKKNQNDQKNKKNQQQILYQKEQEELQRILDTRHDD